MSDIVKTLNKKFKQKTAGVTTEKKKKLSEQEKLKKITEYQEKQTKLEVYPSHMDSEYGDAIYYDTDGLRYIIPAEEILRLYPEYDKWYSSLLIGARFITTVKEITSSKDIILNIVKTDEATSDINELMATMKKRAGNKKDALSRSLCHRLNGERNRVPEVAGTVVNVTKDHIYVDIFDTGLIGTISTLYYRKIYTRDLREWVHVGDILNAQVLRYDTDKDNGQIEFILSTQKFVPNPWKELKKKNMKPGDVIIVRCVDKPFNKTYFWGVSRAAKGLDVMCDYTQKFGTASVRVGQCYKCNIGRIEPDNKIFRVAPFDLANGDNFDLHELKS